MSAGTTIRFLVVAATAVTIIGGAASCGGNEPDNNLPPPASPPVAPTPSPSLDLSPAEQQAVDEAQGHVDTFMGAYVDVSTADLPTPEEAEELFFQVEQHADGVVPQEMRGEIIGMWGAGQTATGELRWQVLEVVNVDLDRRVEGNDIPRVDLRYCIDETGWALIDADTGSTAVGNGSTLVWTLGVSWYDDWGGQGLEGWRVTERQQLGEDPC